MSNEGDHKFKQGADAQQNDNVGRIARGEGRGYIDTGSGFRVNFLC